MTCSCKLDLLNQMRTVYGFTEEEIAAADFTSWQEMHDAIGCLDDEKQNRPGQSLGGLKSKFTSLKS